MGIGAGIGLFFYYVQDAPAFDPNKLKPSETSFVYDENGLVIAELHGEQNRVPIDFDKIPRSLKDAFIAIEDQYFYTHKGINIRSILGALWADIAHREYHRGASTITQQLVKNAFLTQEKTLKRKAQEAWLAIQLERHYTKEDIFEFYLNQIYFGHSAYGVEAAAQTYFGKSVTELTLAESAMLAGITNNPSIYSPFINFDRAKQRQELVLNQMVSIGAITQEEAEKAKAEEIKLQPQQNIKADYKAPYFTDYVITEVVKELQKEYGLTESEAFNKIYNEGLRIYTSLNMDLQETAEKALANPENYPYSKEDANGILQPQAAAVVIDYKTGYIKAMVGGREHQQKLGFNRATQAYRQPGSAFKPIGVYVAALEMGYTAASVIDDSPVTYKSGSGGTWSPKNYSNDFKGLTTLRTAVNNSVNVVAVKLLERIGIDRGIEYAQKLGIKNLVLTGPRNDKQLTMALGGLTKGVTPLELASAYATIANQGIHIEPRAILKVEDKNGRVLIEPKTEQWVAISKQTAYIMTDILRTVVTQGTATRLASLPFPVVGKTGTTSDYKDAWFAGFSPNFVAVVWMGHDDPTPMSSVSGGRQPAIIWKEIMTAAHKNLPKTAFSKPNGIVGPIEICIDSGKLATELCRRDPRGSRVRSEIFVKGTEPAEFCSVHVEKIIDTTTGLLATPYCPPGLTQNKVFIQRPEPYTASSQGQVPLDAKYEAPIEYCNVHGPLDVFEYLNNGEQERSSEYDGNNYTDSNNNNWDTNYNHDYHNGNDFNGNNFNHNNNTNHGNNNNYSNNNLRNNHIEEETN